MSRELLKMNVISAVQKLPEDDIHSIETYIGWLEEDIKQLIECNKKLGAINLQLENIRKEAIEYCNKEIEEIQKHQYSIGSKRLKKILNILNKGSESNE